MRLALLALLLLLGLTLANAFLLRRDLRTAAGMDYAGVQLKQSTEKHIGWDAFVWREIGAVAITVVLYGVVAALGSSTHER